VRGQLGQQRAQHPGGRLRVGQRAVHLGDLDAQRLGERAQLALAGQRREAAGQRDRAQRRRVGPVQAGAFAGLREHPPVEGDVVAHEHATVHLLDQVRQDDFGLGRLVEHRVGDARQALYAARQRRAHRAQRGEAVVQLAAADEHGADLGELAAIAGVAVRLGVDDEELGAAQRVVDEVHLLVSYATHLTAWARSCAATTAHRGSIASACPTAGGVIWMMAFTTDQELERLEIEREAWDVYRATLAELEGKAYEEAEPAAWDTLQQRLAEIAR
jgi:hypothetical protein